MLSIQLSGQNSRRLDEGMRISPPPFIVKIMSSFASNDLVYTYLILLINTREALMLSEVQLSASLATSQNQRMSYSLSSTCLTSYIPAQVKKAKTNMNGISNCYYSLSHFLTNRYLNNPLTPCSPRRYKRSKYGNSDEKMEMYTTLMSAYGASAGIKYRFDGTVANTLQAHRVIQHYQEEKGTKAADEIINGRSIPAA